MPSLTTSVAACLLAAAPAPSTGPAADTLRVFEIDTLAAGVYAARVLPRPDAYAFANSLVVIGDDAALVVDTQQSPTAAGVLVELVRSMAGVPVRYVVNTHWHGDHVYGNQAWADAHAGVRFLAHPATVEAMAREGREQRNEELGTLPASIEDRRGWLETGLGPDGTALSEAEQEQLEYSLRLRVAYLDDLRALRWVDPEPAVSERLALDLGGRVVELIPLGPAHTAGDVAVFVPDAGVLAVGDLLEEAAPWIDGADLAGWARALAELEALTGVALILPAHGDVQRDRRLLEGTAALLGAVVRAARSDEGAAGFDAEAHRPFLATLGVEGEAFDRWIESALEQARRAAAEGGA